MSAPVIFVGPTLPAAEVETALPSCDVRGPAARGDVLRAARGGAQQIGIIDGLYESVPSIWHKEILFALETGTAVYGASSMGAIRASELAPFGMIGVGEIFEEFVDPGRDDDDVAVAHASADDGYVAVSAAQVNIEHATARALAAGVLTGPEADEINQHSKKRFYPERHLESSALAVLGHRAEHVLSWMAAHPADKKADDARAMLEQMRRDEHHPAPDRPRPVLQRTQFFEALFAEVGSFDEDASLVGWTSSLVEEVQIQPALHARVLDRATISFWQRSHAELAGKTLTQDDIDRCSDDLRRRLELWEEADLERWLADHAMTFDDFTALVTRRAMSAAGASSGPRLPVDDVMDEIRLSGLTSTLRERSAHKADHLKRSGGDETGLTFDESADAVLDEALAWFERERTREATGLTLESLTRELGFPSELQLARALLREFRFVTDTTTCNAKPTSTS